MFLIIHNVIFHNIVSLARTFSIGRYHIPESHPKICSSQSSGHLKEWFVKVLSIVEPTPLNPTPSGVAPVANQPERYRYWLLTCECHPNDTVEYIPPVCLNVTEIDPNHLLMLSSFPDSPCGGPYLGTESHPGPTTPCKVIGKRK